MSGSASAPPQKLVFAPIAPAEPETPTLEVAPARSFGGFVWLLLGLVAIAAGVAFLVIEREPEVEVLDVKAAFACPEGTVPTSARMRVMASSLNVRAGPSARADRLNDRTLRKKQTVTEECRSDGWSRVRLTDGRSGWVANEFLSPTSS